MQTYQQAPVHTGNDALLRAYTPYGYHVVRGRPLLAFAGEAVAQAPHCYLLGNGKRATTPCKCAFSAPMHSARLVGEASMHTPIARVIPSTMSTAMAIRPHVQ